MRKFLIGIICFTLVVGVVNIGFAGLFGLFGGGGGHGKGKGGGGSTSLPSGLFNFDFHQFGVKPDTDGRDTTDSTSNYLGYYLNFPEIGSSQLIYHHDGDSDFSHRNFDTTSTGNYKPHKPRKRPGAPDAIAPVPEPASMLLFGTGLVVFGLTRRFKKA